MHACQLSYKYTQSDIMRFRVANSNAYIILHCIPSYAKYLPISSYLFRQNIWCLTRNNVQSFVQSCTYSSNYFIRLFQLSDVFGKSSFVSQYLTQPVSDIVGWARATHFSRPGSIPGRVIRKTWKSRLAACPSLVIGIKGWFQGNGSRAVLPAIDSLSVQRSLWKQPRGSRCKQVEMDGHRESVGASMFLGVQRIFAQIFLPKTLSCNLCRSFLVWPPENGLHSFFWNVGRHFLRSNTVGHHFCPDFQGFCIDV